MKYAQEIVSFIFSVSCFESLILEIIRYFEHGTEMNMRVKLRISFHEKMYCYAQMEGLKQINVQCKAVNC